MDPLRGYNRQRVLETLSDLGPLSQADLQSATGLSRATISSIVSDLRADGLVRSMTAPKAPQGSRGRGRPASLLALAPPQGYAAAVNFGQQHMRVTVAELSPKILGEEEVEFDTTVSGEEALDAAATVFRRVVAASGLQEAQLVRVIIGVPGPINPATGTVLSGVILPGWTKIDPAQGLSRRLGIRVIADNDANLEALGEAAFGAGKGLSDVIYVKVSRGIGAGLVLAGRLHRGVTGIAGEVGHVRVVDNGEACRCGDKGCLETVASVPQVLAALERETGESLGLAELSQRVADGDRAAGRVLFAAGEAIGRVLAPLCNTLNPAAVVTGGALGTWPSPLQDGIRASIDELARLGAADAVVVLPGQLGGRAGALGALSLAAQDEGYLLQPRALFGM